MKFITFEMKQVCHEMGMARFFFWFFFFLGGGGTACANVDHISQYIQCSGFIKALLGKVVVVEEVVVVWCVCVCVWGGLSYR